MEPLIPDPAPRRKRRASIFSRHRTREFQEQRQLTKGEMILADLEETKSTLREDMEKAVERGESLALMDQKVEELQDVAIDFRTNARELKRVTRCAWRRVIIIVAIAVVALLAAVLLGVYFGSCADDPTRFYCPSPPAPNFAPPPATPPGSATPSGASAPTPLRA